MSIKTYVNEKGEILNSFSSMTNKAYLASFGIENSRDLAEYEERYLEEQNIKQKQNNVKANHILEENENKRKQLEKSTKNSKKKSLSFYFR